MEAGRIELPFPRCKRGFLPLKEAPEEPRQGLEPRLNEPKPLVLPLHHQGKNWRRWNRTTPRQQPFGFTDRCVPTTLSARKSQRQDLNLQSPAPKAGAIPLRHSMQRRKRDDSYATCGLRATVHPLTPRFHKTKRPSDFAISCSPLGLGLITPR